MVNKILLTIALLSLSSCAQVSSPYAIGGHYFMVGDEPCAKFRSENSREISCFDAKNRLRGRRVAMSSQEIQMYQFQAMQNQIAEQQAYANLQAQNMRYSYVAPPVIAQPTVMPLSRPGGDQIRCIQVGIYANCRAY